MPHPTPSASLVTRVDQIVSAHLGLEGPLLPILHAVQAALDKDGLRYQVLDVEGEVREWLQWPPPLPTVDQCQPLDVNSLPVTLPFDGSILTIKFVIISQSVLITKH